MNLRLRAVRLAAVAAAVCVAATPAGAACQRLAFLVNDYGKDGPTRDAKALLDKYIVNWTKEKGIKTYTVGPKSVKCELFLNLIVFDEHTCEANALVCWGDGAGKAGAGEGATSKPRPPAAPAAAPAPAAPKPPSAKKVQMPG